MFQSLPDELVLMIVQALPLRCLARLGSTQSHLRECLRPSLLVAHALVPVWGLGWALRPSIPCWSCYNALVCPFPHAIKGVHATEGGDWTVDVPRSLHDALLTNGRFTRRLCSLVPVRLWPMPRLVPNETPRQRANRALNQLAEDLRHPPGELERLVRFYALDWMYAEMRFRRLSNRALQGLHPARCAGCSGRFPLHRDEHRVFHWLSLVSDRIQDSPPSMYRTMNGPPLRLWWDGEMSGLAF